MVITFPAHEAVKPVGKFVTVPIPVAPVVVWLIGVKAVLIHKVEVLVAGIIVLLGLTVMFPVAKIELHPPVKGML